MHGLKVAWACSQQSFALTSLGRKEWKDCQAHVLGTLLWNLFFFFFSCNLTVRVKKHPFSD